MVRRRRRVRLDALQLHPDRAGRQPRSLLAPPELGHEDRLPGRKRRAGAILWKLGYQGNFTLVGDQNAPTDWFFAQHYPNLLQASGNLITLMSVFDNGNDRCYAMPGGCDPVGAPPPPPPSSRGAIFTISETADEGVVVWQAPARRESLTGPAMCTRLVNGNIEARVSSALADRLCSAEDRRALAGGGADPEVDRLVVVWQMTVTTGRHWTVRTASSLDPGVILVNLRCAA